MPKSPGIHTRTNFFIEARWEDESDKRNFPSGMEFKLPYKKGSKGIAVLAIKRFLGLDASSGDFFDEITKVNLVAFQDANRQVLMEIAGYIGEDDSTLSYRSELGVINGPTWALIMAAGDPVTAASIPGFPSHIQPPAGVTIKVAVQETFRTLESNRLLAGDSQNYNPIISFALMSLGIPSKNLLFILIVNLKVDPGLSFGLCTLCIAANKGSDPSKRG